MISYIELHNFKSFSKVTFDLRGPRGIPKKLAFLYGENGAGKSNICGSLFFINQSFRTVINQLSRPKLDLSQFDLVNDTKIKEEFISRYIHQKLYSLEDLIRQYWTIDGTEPMEIKIGFYHDGKDGFYYCKFDKTSVIEERLYYTVNERAGDIFYINKEGATLSPSAFHNIKYRRELSDNIEKFWGKHTFMAILFGEFDSKNYNYVSTRISSNLEEILKSLKHSSILYKANDSDNYKIAVPYRFLQQLDCGIVSSKTDPELLAFQDMLNACFTQLYSDIKKVYYKFQKLDKGYQYELFFNKLCGGRECAVPISLESTGTQKILDIFPLLFTCNLNNTVFVDEVDTGIHDLLMQDIVGILESALESTDEGQFIATTHNTLLLDTLKPENVYILRSDILGQKEISCITDYSSRTHKNNSIRHRYLNGIYQGVPEVGYIDFAELISDTEDKINKERKNVRVGGKGNA